MTAKKNQTLQNGSAKVGVGRGRGEGRGVPGAPGSAYQLCHMNTSHISCCPMGAPVIFICLFDAIVWNIIKEKG